MKAKIDRLEDGSPAYIVVLSDAGGRIIDAIAGGPPEALEFLAQNKRILREQIAALTEQINLITLKENAIKELV